MLEPKIPMLKNELIDVMREELVTQRWSLLKAGQRSGKNFIAEQIIKRAGYGYVVICSTSTNFSRDRIEWMKEEFPDVEFSVNSIPKHWPANATVFVLMDEAMWIPGSYELFLAFKENPMCRVLVVSSRGPEYDKELRWQLLAGHSFSTWDLNPDMTLTELLPDIDRNGSSAFFRDYCSY